MRVVFPCLLFYVSVSHVLLVACYSIVLCIGCILQFCILYVTACKLYGLHVTASYVVLVLLDITDCMLYCLQMRGICKFRFLEGVIPLHLFILVSILSCCPFVCLQGTLILPFLKFCLPPFVDLDIFILSVASQKIILLPPVLNFRKKDKCSMSAS